MDARDSDPAEATPDWERLETLYFELLEAPESERVARLATLADSDEHLRAEVEAMLKASSRGTRLRIDRWLDETPALQPEIIESRADERVGRYRLVGLIGQGGMGEVYRAERVDGAYAKEVAVKLLRRGLHHPEARRRFESERQILASLDHPDVVGILDGGTTDEDQPYLVMPLVEGTSITEYCDRNRLTIDERIDLFIRVTKAVQFAHQSLVVHRDLKPSNILVTAAGEVRLLDFGIAKLLDPTGLGNPTAATREIRALTPEYAAPEQVRGEPVTTATDVYGLGVLLYELVTGTLPYPTHDGFHEMASEVLTGDPLSPSRALSARGTRPTAKEEQKKALRDVARHRGGTLREVQSKVSGDLERIILMALRKDPQRRYQSAGQLAEDLERHRAHLPVRARPDSVSYRAKKFVRRNRVGVAAGSALLLGGLGFGGLAVYQRGVAQAERDRARLAAERSEAVVNVLVEMFASTSPATNPEANSITLAEFLARTEASIVSDLDRQPEVVSRLLAVMGQIRRAREQREAALSLFERAEAVEREAVGEDSELYADVLHAIAMIRLRDDPEARALLEASVERIRERFGDPSPRLADALMDLAWTERDPNVRAEAAEASMAMRRELLDAGIGSPRNLRIGLAEGLNTLGMQYYRVGRLDRAADAFTETLEHVQTLYPENHHNWLQVASNLTTVLMNLGQLDESERLAMRVYEGRQALFDPPHGTLVNSLATLGNIALRRGRYLDADSLQHEALAMQRRIGPGSMMGALGRVAQTRQYLGDHEAALLRIQEGIAIGSDVRGPGVPQVLRLRTRRASIIGLDDPAAAVDSLEALLEQMRPAAPAGGANFVAGAEAALGHALLKLGRPTEAADVLRASLAFQEPALGADHVTVKLLEGWLGVALFDLGNRAAADSLLRASFSAIEAHPLVLETDRQLVRDRFAALP